MEFYFLLVKVAAKFVPKYNVRHLYTDKISRQLESVALRSLRIMYDLFVKCLKRTSKRFTTLFLHATLF